MPMLFADEKDVIKCNCGNKLLYERDLFTFKKEDFKGKIVFTKTVISKDLVCSLCNKTVAQGIHRAEIKEVPVK